MTSPDYVRRPATSLGLLHRDRRRHYNHHVRRAGVPRSQSPRRRLRPNSPIAELGCEHGHSDQEHSGRRAALAHQNDAISRVVAETKARGGNAIICLRFESGDMGGFAQYCAYGTAAIVEKIDPSTQVPLQLVN
ncbi:hypothetical protein GL218_09041 [Daldinia childiae]|uniref:uncharacterized protein n=1 Tax=Daldinia childiae TaxID=326645 RepID=UPI001445DA3F|nr:uncharacterized protein GL218_09041 [Daldinia childiae]KAF3066597.1 hypothetical protein GL218_09041 [Daldinia childiae]